MQDLQRVRGESVVRVQEYDVRAFRLCDLKPSCMEQAAVFLVKHPDARIGPGEGVKKSGASVGGSVIREDELIIRERLAEDGMDAFREIGFGIVYRNQDAEVRACASLFHSRLLSAVF